MFGLGNIRKYYKNLKWNTFYIRNRDKRGHMKERHTIKSSVRRSNKKPKCTCMQQDKGNNQ